MKEVNNIVVSLKRMKSQKCTESYISCLFVSFSTYKQIWIKLNLSLQGYHLLPVLVVETDPEYNLSDPRET